MVNRHRTFCEVILSLVLEEIVLAGGKARPAPRSA